MTAKSSVLNACGAGEGMFAALCLTLHRGNALSLVPLQTIGNTESVRQERTASGKRKAGSLANTIWMVAGIGDGNS